LNTQQAAPLIASLAGVGLALGWTGSSLATGHDVYAQLLRGPTTSWQAKVRDCRGAAAVLTGAEHRKFMSNCLKKP